MKRDFNDIRFNVITYRKKNTQICEYLNEEEGGMQGIVGQTSLSNRQSYSPGLFSGTGECSDFEGTKACIPSTHQGAQHILVVYAHTLVACKHENVKE